MNQQKLASMQNAYEMCQEDDRSLEYMIEFIKDYSGADHYEVMDFLFQKSKEEVNK